MNSNPFKNNRSQYNKPKRPFRERPESLNNFRGNAPKRPAVPEINCETMFPELGGNISKCKLQKEIAETNEEEISTDIAKSENYLVMANKETPVIKTTKELAPGWVHLSWNDDGKLHKYSRDKKSELSETEKKEQQQIRFSKVINKIILIMKERWYKYDAEHGLDFVNYDKELEDSDFEEVKEEYYYDYEEDLEMNEELMGGRNKDLKA